jgi:hypothetical protein
MDLPMRKMVLLLFLVSVLGGALGAEAHVLGFACTDVDLQGTNTAVVFLMIQDSPAAARGGLMMKDVLLSVNKTDLRGMMWKDIPVYTKSDKPTVFDFVVLREGKEVSVKLTSIPASSLSGKERIMADQTQINPHLRELKFPFEPYQGRISANPKSVADNQVSIRIRYAGETWWIYDQVHQLGSDGKLPITPITIIADVSRLYYVEMVYKDTDGKFYGDYMYKRGDEILWGNGYDRIVLFSWQQFTRPQSQPDWNVLMGQTVGIKGSFSFWLKDKAYAFYKNQGYVFPDQANLTILDNNNKPVFDQDFTVKSKWDTGYWGLPSNELMYEIPKQAVESQFTFILTVKAQKDGQLVPLTFKVRENVFTRRSNQGSFLESRADVIYHFTELGQITKIRY